MKSLKRWALALSLAGPTVLNLSCSSTFWRELRDAAYSGASSFVQQLTIDLLDQTVGSIDAL